MNRNGRTNGGKSQKIFISAEELVVLAFELVGLAILMLFFGALISGTQDSTRR
jgi:hypothetical protein